MPVRAVLFDLDGTLLNTLADIAAATNDALKELGLAEHPVAAYRGFVGSGIRVLAERALGSEANEKRIESVIATAGRRMGENTFTRPYSGVTELLAKLQDRYVLGILSNKPQEIVGHTVERFLPGVSFAAVVGQRVGVPEKPDPAMAHNMMHVLGVVPADVVYLGDSDVDMMTATNTGMFGVGAAWGFRGRSELERAGAGTVIDHPDELPPLLEERGA